MGHDGARDARNSRGPRSRRVRIEALRASQRLVLGAAGPNDRDSSTMVGEEDERWASYTTLTDLAADDLGVQARHERISVSVIVFAWKRAGSDLKQLDECFLGG
jgi:hypothetical protein